jgi:cobyrinic acid a,c-diamide synthase
VVREAFAVLGGPPVLGALPRFSEAPLPARHLGLLPAAEHGASEQAIEFVADAVLADVDLGAVETLARAASPVTFPEPASPHLRPTSGVRIAVLRDEAFSFYYPENLEALTAAGARLIEVSPLRAAALPSVDAVYAGGGFPEAHAAALSANSAFQASLRDAVADGLPVYAECGGLMYLARELHVGGRRYPMAGVLDLAIEQTPRPQGHGYVEARVDAPNPFFPVGTRLRGHEFHYSRPIAGDIPPTVLQIERGTGLGASRDGIVTGRVWGSYLHLHALGAPGWATGLVAAAAGRHARVAASA